MHSVVPHDVPHLAPFAMRAGAFCRPASALSYCSFIQYRAMQTPPLPRDELIAIRDGNKRNADIRALLREIRRQHEVILAVEQLRQSIDRAWKDETGSQLAGLHALRALLQPELGRFREE